MQFVADPEHDVVLRVAVCAVRLEAERAANIGASGNGVFESALQRHGVRNAEIQTLAGERVDRMCGVSERSEYKSARSAVEGESGKGVGGSVSRLTRPAQRVRQYTLRHVACAVETTPPSWLELSK